MKKYNFVITIFIIFIIANMVIWPQIYIKETLNGISAWAFNVLPSVLPFIFFTKILSNLGGIEKTSMIFSKPMNKLFKSPSVASYVFFMSVISGYPVGAKMTADLYQSGKISRSEAFRMTSFCSTSGPMFIIGAVGASMLLSPFFGYIIFISHILGAFLNGLIYRNIKVKDLPNSKFETTKRRNDLSEIVSDSAMSIISVGVIIAIFFVVIRSLAPIFSLMPSSVASILKGMIEITKGCIDISSCFSPRLAVIASTFVISFGGLSTLLQSLTMLDKIKMPALLFALQKFTQAIISTIISFILILLI